MQGLGSRPVGRVLGFGIRVLGSGARILGSGVRVLGSGVTVVVTVSLSFSGLSGNLGVLFLF